MCVSYLPIVNAYVLHVHIPREYTCVVNMPYRYLYHSNIMFRCCTFASCNMWNVTTPVCTFIIESDQSNLLFDIWHWHYIVNVFVNRDLLIFIGNGELLHRGSAFHFIAACDFRRYNGTSILWSLLFIQFMCWMNCNDVLLLFLYQIPYINSWPQYKPPVLSTI